MIKDPRLPQFETDYIITWDVSDNDHPCIAVSVLHRNEPGPGLMCEVLGNSFERTGTVSVLQLIEQHRALKRAEAERMKDAEALRKTFGQKEEEDKNAT